MYVSVNGACFVWLVLFCFNTRGLAGRKTSTTEIFIFIGCFFWLPSEGTLRMHMVGGEGTQQDPT